jgi:hypothetical protein
MNKTIEIKKEIIDLKLRIEELEEQLIVGKKNNDVQNSYNYEFYDEYIPEEKGHNGIDKYEKLMQFIYDEAYEHVTQDICYYEYEPVKQDIYDYEYLQCR